MTETKPGFVAQVKSYPNAFWVANTMEIFERMSWYGFFAVSSLYLTGPIETGALGFTSEQRGSIQAIIPFLLYLMPVVTGALADRYGYKKMFIIAYLGMAVSYYFLGQFTTIPTFMAAFMAVAVAAAIFKPVVVGTVAKVTNESNSATGFGIFYMMVNIGGFFGPIVAGILRGWSWTYVFAASALWALVNLIIVLVFYRDPSTEATSEQRRTLKKVGEDMVDVLGNMRFGITVFTVLIALMIGNLEFDWFTWRTCSIFIAVWLVLNFVWDRLMPEGSGDPKNAASKGRFFFLKRMHCSNWRFAIFLLIMSGFWTSFNQIFLTMPLYIRDFTETKPLVDASRSVLGLIGKPEWADHLASVDDNELLAEYDRLIRQARGVGSAVPDDPEEKDEAKRLSILRGKMKSLRADARKLGKSKFLPEDQQQQARDLVERLTEVDKQDEEAMKALKKEVGPMLDELGRVAGKAALQEDPRMTDEVRARLSQIVGTLNAAEVEDPLEVYDLVQGTRKILGYKVRLSPVEFAELLARAPREAISPSDEVLADAAKKLNKRLHKYKQPKFEEAEFEELKTLLSGLITEHGPLVSQEATVALSEVLSTDERKVEPKQLIVAINAVAYRDSIWDRVHAARQFNPEFIVNINALGIVLFQVLISVVMARFHRFTTMIIGMIVAAVGIGLSATAGDNGILGGGGIVWIVAGGIFVFSFGEMMASPTSQEYVGRIAPGDKKALYMGYYFVAVALGNLFGGILSGQLYGKLARDAQRPDLMWIVFGGIMLLTAVVFMLYNKFALPKDAAHKLMPGDSGS